MASESVMGMRRGFVFVTIFSRQKFRNDIRNLDNLLVRYHSPLSLYTLAPWILYFVPRASSLDVLFALLSPSPRELVTYVTVGL